MTRIASAWSRVARLRRRVQNARRPLVGWDESRYQWIREHAPGRSFADVGGLFDKEGDFAFAAEEAGATRVTCFDAGDPDLCGFAAKHEARNSQVRFVQGDLDEPESVREIGEHDVVWCTGVIYHSPTPVRQLINLREITRELLYLGTLTLPEIPGFPQACIYYPYLGDGARNPYAKGYLRPEDFLAIGTPFDDTPMRGHANCWWGMTRSALRAMLATARFEVVEEREVHYSPWISEFVARPVPRDPALPPLPYFRERGKRRERGERLPFETWYEEQRQRTKA